MKRLWIPLLLVVGCSSDGEHSNGERQEEPNGEVEVDPRIEDHSTSVSFQIRSSSLAHVTACDNVKRLQGPSESESITVDGQFADWNETTNFAVSTQGQKSSPLTVIKFATHGRAHFLGTIDAKSEASIQLRFGVFRQDKSDVIPEVTRVFLLEGNTVRRIVENAALPVEGASIATTAEQMEFALPYEAMEGVFLYSNWFFEVVVTEHGKTRRDGVTVVESNFAPANRIQVKSCGDKPKTRLQLITSRTVPEEIHKEILGLTEFSHNLLGTFGFDVRVLPNNIPIVANIGTSDVVKQADLRLYIENGMFPVSVNPSSMTWRHDFVADIFRILVKSQLMEIGVTAHPLLREALANALVDRMQEHSFGYEMWTKSFLDEAESNWERGENAQLQGLENQCNLQWCEPRHVGRARAFGRILSRRFGEILGGVASNLAMSEAHSVIGYEDFTDALKETEEANWRTPNDVWNGWAVGQGFMQAGYASIDLEDDDQDGIPTILEAEVGGNWASADTDSDGWSDLSELIAGTDHRTLASHPGHIVIDGLYGDWQSLLTSKLLEDTGISSPACGAAGDISFHSALMDAETGLVFGAATKQQNGTEPRKWSGFVSVVTQDDVEAIFQIDAFSGSRSIVVYDIGKKEGGSTIVLDAMQPVRSGSFEFLIGKAIFQELGVNIKDAKSVSIRVQNFLIGDENIMCDETPWIKPLASGPH